MQRWEYLWLLLKVGIAGGFDVSVSGRTFMGQQTLDFLNNLGQQGWEMITVIAHINGMEFTAWFKRPVE